MVMVIALSSFVSAYHNQSVVILADNFTRANSATIGGDWYAEDDGQNKLTINNNRLQGDMSGTVDNRMKGRSGQITTSYSMSYSYVVSDAGTGLIRMIDRQDGSSTSWWIGCGSDKWSFWDGGSQTDMTDCYDNIKYNISLHYDLVTDKVAVWVDDVFEGNFSVTSETFAQEIWFDGNSNKAPIWYLDDFLWINGTFTSGAPVVTNEISLTSPINDTITNNATVTFDYNVTGEASSCSLLIDGAVNQSLPSTFDYCYQESATINDQTGIDGNCGLLYDGSYIYTTNENPGIIFINYSIPNFVNTSNVIWQVKHGNIPTYNITLPPVALISETLQLRTELLITVHNYQSMVKYYNGTDWVQIGNNEIGNAIQSAGSDIPTNAYDGDWNTLVTVGYSNYGFHNLASASAELTFYEEAVYWSFVTPTFEFDTGIYDWGVTCDFGTENVTTDNRTIEIDLVEPTINIGTGLQNKAVIGLLTGQINISDDNLYGINISDSTGTLFYNISYSGTELLYNLSVNTSAYPQGFNTINIRSSDGHTASKIKEYKHKTSIFNNDIIYEFDDGHVRINPEGITGTLTTTKKKDRYNFEFDRPDYKKNDNIVFYIESNNYIDYLSDSKYDAHFVVPQLNKWIDFELEGATGDEKYDVEKISNTEYKVTISKVKDLTDITFNSIGDLNVNEVNLTWYNAKAVTIYTATLAENQADTYTLAVNHTGLGAYFDTMSANMYYNTTLVSQDSKVTVSEITTWSFSNTAPEIGSYEENFNVTFTATINQAGNLSVNDIESTQKVIKLAIGACTSDEFNTTALTIYGINEENYNESLDFVMNADFELYLLGESSRTEISQQYSGADNYSLCLRDNETDLYADATIEYFDASGLFSNRKYYLYQYNLNVTGRELNLYLLNDTLASDITLKVVDSNGVPVPNAFVKVLRYYPELGQNFVVEIGKTDNEGEAGSKQILADPLYSYIIQTGSTIRVTTNPGRLLSTLKIFTLGKQTNELESYKGLLNIDYNIFYDESTNTFNFVWNDATGLTDTMCLEVYQRSGFKDTVICSRETNCLTANAGNLVCDIGASPSGQYFAQVYLETNTANSEYIFTILDRIFKTTYNWGKEGILGAILLISAGALAMTFSPVGVILGTLIGLIGAVMLSLVNVGAGFVVTAIVVGVIIIMRLKE